MVKAAIIGCGKIAQVRHIPEYPEHQAVNLVGFYDLNEKRAEELAEKYPPVSLPHRLSGRSPAF